MNTFSINVLNSSLPNTRVPIIIELGCTVRFKLGLTVQPFELEDVRSDHYDVHYNLTCAKQNYP